MLREKEPNRYEARAEIALDRWTPMDITAQGSYLAAYADGVLILTGKGKPPPRKGRISLWVDNGTEGFVTNLSN